MHASVVAAIAAAVLASVLFGASAALMAYAAFTAPSHVRGLRALLGHLVRNRVWLLGEGASLLGLGLHTAALALGPLTVVQPIVVTSLIFSFFFRSALERRLPGRGVVVGAGVTTAGLVLFLTAADVGGSGGGDTFDSVAAFVSVGLGLLVVAAATVGAEAVTGPRSAFLIGSAAGVTFGLVAGTLKASTVEAADGPWHLLATWPVYALAACGTVGFVLNQRAYRAFALTWSLPSLNTVNPVVALLFGYVAFGDRPASSVLSLVGVALGLGLVAVGIVVVSLTPEPAPALPATPVPML